MVPYFFLLFSCECPNRLVYSGSAYTAYAGDRLQPIFVSVFTAEC